MSKIVLNNLSVKFVLPNKSIVTALENFNATFNHGSTTVILGKSGSGKTSLLKSIIGTYLYNGEITINGIDASKLEIKDKNISYVSQDFDLYPNMTVFDNIAFPLTVIRADYDEIEERVNEIAQFFGLERLLSRKPKELSVGQRQKVAFARALVKKSDLYLLDEPFSNLDEKISDDIKENLRKYFKQTDVTVLLVTHNPRDAFFFKGNLIILEEGKKIYDGDPYEVMDTNDENVKSYFNNVH